MAISVCDITRAQPRPQMLRAILEEMPDVRSEDVTVFIATGTHRGNTAAEEVEAMLGPDLAGELRVVMHDARDPASLTYLGETSNGRADLAQSRVGRVGHSKSRQGSWSPTSSPDSAADPRWWRRGWPGSTR